VEAKVLRDLHGRKLIGDREAPFPLIDVASMLHAQGRKRTSLDKYAHEFGLVPDKKEYGGGDHNPLYDAAVAAAVYYHLLRTYPL
jgi:hypothetical protein